MLIKNTRISCGVKKYFILLFLLIFLPVNIVKAAEVFFDRDKQVMSVRQQFILPLYIDTEDQPINAFEGQIVFPTDLLRVKEIRYHDSFINFWIEQPQFNNNNIKFSGIIPGGYLGKKSLVLSVVFEALAVGRGEIGFENLRILLNDGAGSDAPVRSRAWSFEINTSEPIILNEIKDIVDHDSPEDFVPILTKVVDIAADQYILIFATQDKGSGISHYEVKEGWHNWVVAISPYILQNQNLDQEIIVKAVDKAGNERLVVVPSTYPRKWYEKYEISGIIIFVVLLVIISYLFAKKKKKSRKT